NGDTILSVGGFYDGLIVELEPGECTDVTPPQLRQLQGVFVAEDGSAVAAGNAGAIWRRSSDGEWAEDEDAPPTELSYHQVFQDTEGGVWAVGGFLEGSPLERGLLTYFGN